MQIKSALRSGVGSIDLVPITARGVIAVRVRHGSKRVGKLLLPPEGTTLADLLYSLGQMAEEA